MCNSPFKKEHTYPIPHCTALYHCFCFLFYRIFSALFQVSIWYAHYGPNHLNFDNLTTSYKKSSLFLTLKKYVFHCGLLFSFSAIWMRMGIDAFVGQLVVKAGWKVLFSGATFSYKSMEDLWQKSWELARCWEQPCLSLPFWHFWLLWWLYGMSTFFWLSEFSWEWLRLLHFPAFHHLFKG